MTTVVAVLSVAAACGDAGVERDDTSGTPLRIVSLVPAASQTLAALGLSASVVGKARQDLTPGLTNARVVGDVLSPNLERIVAARPTAVVVWAEADLGPLRRTTSRVGATLVTARFDRLEDAVDRLMDFGERFERRDRADELVLDLAQDLERVRSEAPARGLTMAWVVWSDPPIVAGPSTLPDDLIRVVGGSNTFATAGTSWPRPSWEALLSADVDVLVWPRTEGMPAPADLPPSSHWWSVPAFRSGRLVDVDGDLTHEAGPKVGEAAKSLALGIRTIRNTHSPFPEQGRL